MVEHKRPGRQKRGQGGGNGAACKAAAPRSTQGQGHLTEGWARRKDPFLSPAPLAAREIPLVMYKFNFIPRHQTAHLSSTGG